MATSMPHRSNPPDSQRRVRFPVQHSYLGEYYRRMRAKLGAPKAIVAAAHKLARIFYHLISTRQLYQESVFAELEAKFRQRAQARLEAQARVLGFRLARVEA